jgi:hypothetical protein
MEEKMQLIFNNQEIIDFASNKYDLFGFDLDDKYFIHNSLSTGAREPISVIAAAGAVRIFNNPDYSFIIETVNTHPNAKLMSREDLEFIVMFGLSIGLINYYRRREANRASWEAYYDKSLVNENNSRNRVSEEAYDDRYLSISPDIAQIIETILDYQEYKRNSNKQ